MNKIYYIYVKGNFCNKCYIKYTNNIKEIFKIFKNIVSIYDNKYNKIY